MTTIKLENKVLATVNKVFDLHRNIDMHQQSTSKSKESAIDGTTTGLISKNHTVTWRGKHFGLFLTHQSIISEMQIPNFFVDEMLKGHFKSFKHKHTFINDHGATIVQDEIEYETPFGVFGMIFNKLVLKKYLTKFITERNTFLKNRAEQK